MSYVMTTVLASFTLAFAPTVLSFVVEAVAGSAICWNVKTTSSAVKALPSCHVTPGRSRMIQLDSDPCGVIDSASTYSTCAWALSWARGW